MKFIPASIEDVFIVEPELFSDSRGWFARTYCKTEFKEIGHTKEWVQINHSFTVNKGAIRGMHYQVPPHSEIKLIRCISGAAWDVAIDLRKNSDTFLKWVSVELTAANKKMIYIPEAFAHGFQALTDNCELIYHHSSFYAKEAERGIRYDDPMVAIKWPLPVTDISERDLSHTLLDKTFKGIL